MILDTGKKETLRMSIKSPKVSSNYDERKIMERGKYYLTPFTLDHVDEVTDNLSNENKRELALMGRSDVRAALIEMYESSECYLARREGGKFIFVGGLWYSNQDAPQMFAMFSDDLKDNFISIARGSKMLVNQFDKTEDTMTMSILADYEGMINWATWLGFQPISVSLSHSVKYVDFVRCNLNQNNVYDIASRPVVH